MLFNHKLDVTNNGALIHLLFSVCSVQIYRTEVTHLVQHITELDGIRVAQASASPKFMNESTASIESAQDYATFGERTPD